MSDFDLRQLVADELATSAVADPAVVADHVLKQVPDEHLRDALATCLPGWVSRVAHRPLNRSASASKLGRSRKCDDQAWYRGILRRRLEVGQDGREWKFLGDCTRDDVLRAAQVRRDQAAANLAVAAQLEKLAEKMRVFRASTVADLDAGLLAEVLA